MTPLERVCRASTFVFDLDGCLYRGEEPAPGAADLLRDLVAAGRRIRYLTNNSFETREQILARLQRMGFPTEPGALVTALDVAARAIRRRRGPAAVLALGPAAMAAALQAEGHRVVDEEAWWEAAAVLVGRDTGLTYARLQAAAWAIDAGAEFWACSRDARLPGEGGRFYIGTGAIVALLEAATGRAPHIAGKPAPVMFQEALELWGVRPEEAVMVGDSLASDVRGARAAGLAAVWVRTGVALAPGGVGHPSGSVGDAVPDVVVGDLGELRRLLAGPLRTAPRPAAR